MTPLRGSDLPGVTTAQMLDRSVVLRELMPKELKLDIDRLSREEAVNSTRYLAEIVGNAPAQQMDAATRKEFSARFRVPKSAPLDAPSWLPITPIP
jgi:hypothetical protein